MQRRQISGRLAPRDIGELELLSTLREGTAALRRETDEMPSSMPPSETPHEYLVQLQAILSEHPHTARVFGMSAYEFLSRRIKDSGGMTHAHLVAYTVEGARVLQKRFFDDPAAVGIFSLEDNEGVTVLMAVQKTLGAILPGSELRSEFRSR